MEPMSDGGRMHRRLVSLHASTYLPQEVAHRQIGGSLAIRQTPPLVHRHLIPRYTAAEFRQKPGLAYARVADQAHHLPLSSDRRRQVVMEQRQLPLSAYKGTPSPLPPPCHASVSPQGSLHRVHRHRGG